MNHSIVPLHLVLILSTAIIITARPNILEYERIRKYRYSVGEGTTSKTSLEPLSSATIKTTTSLLSTTITTTTTTTTVTEEGTNHHDHSFSASSINHISYDDFIHLTCLHEEKEKNHNPSASSSSKSCYPSPDDDDSSSNVSSSPHNHDNHTNTNKLHRTFLRIPTTISASKVILESEEINEDHLFESYIYS